MTLPALHAGQQRLDVLQSTHRFTVAMCGRRFGKTEYGIEKSCRVALHGQKVGWFSPSYKFANDAWREIKRRLGPACRSISEQEKRLETYTGGVIEVWTLDQPDAGRSRSYDLVVIDEAGLVRALSEAWYGALRPTLADRKGRALFLGTPKGRTHDFSMLFAKGDSGEPEWCSVRAGTAENPYIDPNEILAAKREMPPAIFAQEFEGIPADDGGNPFGLDAIATAFTMDPDVIAKRRKSLPVAWGWDFARAQDWTVGIALNADGDECRFERWQLVPWSEQIAKVAKLTKSDAKESRGLLIHGDSTGIGDVVVEGCQRAGVPMVPVFFSVSEKQRMMERLAVALQSQTIKLHSTIIKGELDTFGYEYAAHGVRYSAPDGLHDDCVMSLALAVRAWDLLRVQPGSAFVPKIASEVYADKIDYKTGKVLTPEPLMTQVRTWQNAQGFRTRVSAPRHQKATKLGDR